MKSKAARALGFIAGLALMICPPAAVILRRFPLLGERSVPFALGSGGLLLAMLLLVVFRRAVLPWARSLFSRMPWLGDLLVCLFWACLMALAIFADKAVEIYADTIRTYLRDLIVVGLAGFIGGAAAFALQSIINSRTDSGTEENNEVNRNE